MKNALVLMTALVPTTGHADLLRFAASLPQTDVFALISGRSFEPTSARDRASSLAQNLADYDNITFSVSNEDHAPQYPDVAPNQFWDWWVKEVNTNFPYLNGRWDYVVASEEYGQPMADALGAQFIPYDINRELNPVQGTEVRVNLEKNWNDIIPEFRKNLQVSAVFFGQESVGKTTISKMVADRLNGVWYPEYARPYLEQVGAELSEQKMLNITAGQAAMQKISRKASPSPFVCLDTDLFSTVGYYEIWKHDVPKELVTLALDNKSDVYYVLPDDVPFEKDILRYGGDKRESTTEFWHSLLWRYVGASVRVPKGTAEEKASWIAADIRTRFYQKNRKIPAFRREQG